MVIALLVMGYSNDSRAAQRQSDADITQKIVGTWKVNETSLRGTSARGTVTIKKDGTLTSKSSYLRGDFHMDFDFAGKWQVTNGFLSETITASSNTNLCPLGSVALDKILTLDDQHLVYQAENGRIISRLRVQ